LLMIHATIEFKGKRSYNIGFLQKSSLLYMECR